MTPGPLAARLILLLLVAMAAGCAGDDDPATANEQLVARYYEEVFNDRNLEFLNEALRNDVVGHGPGMDDRVEGIAQVAAFSAYVYEIYDDYRLTVDQLFGRGDFVQVRATVTAVHRPTGRPVRFFGLSVYRLEGGQIAEYWRAYDRLDLYERQLGGWRPDGS